MSDGSLRVVVHGGAGGAPDEPERRQRHVDAAAETGADAETPVDAVVEAVRVLESAPGFDAGVGSYVQSDGVARTDAGLMDGDRAVGAAAAMPGVEHAVDVARVVKEETPHVLVAGERAVDLADAFGVETGCDLWTGETRRTWEAADPPEGDVREQLNWVRERFSGHDTVGAVAAADGEFAAATSTGGRWFALAGRVGDVPQVGSGFYASPDGAASVTGAGEDIARTTLARTAVDRLGAVDAADAAREALASFEDATGSEAGLVVVDGDGHGTAFNTEAMQTAVATRNR